MTTITALTAQNTTGVRDIHFVPKEFVQKSLEAVFEDMPVDVVKTGMLGSAGTIGTVAKVLKKYNVTKIVIDPVWLPFFLLIILFRKLMFIRSWSQPRVQN
jgi:hydroxymethylpyrimidine/phosphomethylpyrimidine kinase